MKRKILTIFGLFITILFLSQAPNVSGAEYKSMKGIASAKAVFDERGSDPKNVASHLQAVFQTYKELVLMQKNPAFVILFMGPAVKLISTNRAGYSPGDQKSLDEIANSISAMSKTGININIEISLADAKVFNVNPASVLPQINKVENGWISLIGYQAQGYTLVPVY